MELPNCYAFKERTYISKKGRNAYALRLREEMKPLIKKMENLRAEENTRTEQENTKLLEVIKNLIGGEIGNFVAMDFLNSQPLESLVQDLRTRDKISFLAFETEISIYEIQLECAIRSLKYTDKIDEFGGELKRIGMEKYNPLSDSTSPQEHRY